MKDALPWRALPGRQGHFVFSSPPAFGRPTLDETSHPKPVSFFVALLACPRHPCLHARGMMYRHMAPRTSSSCRAGPTAGAPARYGRMVSGLGASAAYRRLPVLRSTCAWCSLPPRVKSGRNAARIPTRWCARPATPPTRWQRCGATAGCDGLAAVGAGRVPRRRGVSGASGGAPRAGLALWDGSLVGHFGFQLRSRDGLSKLPARIAVLADRGLAASDRRHALSGRSTPASPVIVRTPVKQRPSRDGRGVLCYAAITSGPREPL